MYTINKINKNPGIGYSLDTRVLYLDAFNLFQANYRSNTAMDSNGEAIGGFLGTLLQIRGLIHKFSPQKVLVIFDGPDAGLRRRSLYSGYKSKRRAKKRTATINLAEGLSVQVENETEQLEKLFAALKLLPVDMICIPYYEADDVIAYLVKRNPNFNNIIVSNDKDYLQLITEKTWVYQFTKKRLMDLKKTGEEFEIDPSNILYYRSIVGDSSDELIGLKGVGEGTVKKLDIFNKRKFESFDDFWSEIENIEESKSKKITLLKESQKDVLLMYQLMRLDETCLNQRAIDLLESQLVTELKKQFSTIMFKGLCIRCNLNTQIKDVDGWMTSFYCLKRKIEVSI